MNNLIQNYKIILKELTKNCNHITSSKKIRLPKMSDLELVALNITAEYMSINSELQLFRCISGTVLDGKIERSVYNKRKRKLFPYIEKIRETLSSKFSDFTDIFIVDSTPIEICKISRANRSAICSTNEIKPLDIVLHKNQDILAINFMRFVTRMESFIPLILHLQMFMMSTTLMILRKIFKIVC